MFPFDRPKDYGEMLNKIGIFTFLFALGLTWFVAERVDSIHAVLNSRQTTVDVASIHVPILYVVPAAVVAFFARIVRLHDKVSDIFRIRKRFDINKILVPLSEAVGLKVDGNFLDQLRNRREDAMERTFYRYASFEDPKISKALVLGAVELWTWYWIALESAVWAFVAALVLLANAQYIPASALLAVTGGLILLFLGCFTFCGRRAEYQIREIVSDDGRATTIRGELSKFLSLV